MNVTAPIAPAHQQHLRALARANQIRLARAQLKRRVAAGEIDVADVLVYCPWEAQSMAVADLLISQRRWGQTRCRKALARLPMSEQKTVGSMTDRQRHALATMLGSAEEEGTRGARPASVHQRAFPASAELGASSERRTAPSPDPLDTRLHGRCRSPAKLVDRC